MPICIGGQKLFSELITFTDNSNNNCVLLRNSQVSTFISLSVYNKLCHLCFKKNLDISLTNPMQYTVCNTVINNIPFKIDFHFSCLNNSLLYSNANVDLINLVCCISLCFSLSTLFFSFYFSVFLFE